MPETFTWTPQRAYQLNVPPNVAVVKLGDGYEQRQVKGINPLMDKYSLTFRGVSGACRSNPAKDAEAFLKAVGRLNRSTDVIRYGSEEAVCLPITEYDKDRAAV